MKFSIRPLTALAVVLSAFGAVQASRLALNASQAWAETQTKGDSASAASEGASAAPAANGTSAPPTCLPVDLAKEAGISAAEFRLLQNLQDRRQTLDERERDIITREGIIKTADDIVKARLATLAQVEANLQRLLGQVDEVESQRLAALVRVYEKMKPKDAARVMEGLSDEVVISIASRMKDQPLALVLAKMAPARARQITTMLARMDDGRLAEATNPPAQAAATTPRNNAPLAKGAPASPTAAPNAASAPSAAAAAAPATSPANAASGQAPRDPSAAAPKAKS
jgi:flagellar motility protein MotE (MotC chaperone)